MQPHRRQPIRLSCPWDSPGKNIGVGCHFLLQCIKVKIESEVSQSCLTLHDPMDCSLPGTSIHGLFLPEPLRNHIIRRLEKSLGKATLFSQYAHGGQKRVKPNRYLCPNTKLNLTDRVWSEVEKSSFLALLSKGVQSRQQCVFQPRESMSSSLEPDHNQ